MKSSTIRRSNLSKEKIAVLEALSKFKNQNAAGSNSNDGAVNGESREDGAPEVYVRPGKEKELDLLWQNFRRPKVESSPVVYLGIGFVSGIALTLIVSAIIGLTAAQTRLNFKFNIPSVSSPGEQNGVKLDFLPPNSSASTDTGVEENVNEEYTVQNGDTMEAIARRFYGSYSPDYVNKIMKANNIANPNRLSIGQKLVIPMGGTEESANTPAEDEQQ